MVRVAGVNLSGHVPKNMWEAATLHPDCERGPFSPLLSACEVGWGDNRLYWILG